MSPADLLPATSPAVKSPRLICSILIACLRTFVVARCTVFLIMALLSVALGTFSLLLADSFKYVHRSLPRLQRLENDAPRESPGA